MTITTNSPEQTELLGKKLAALLKPGDVIAYYGDLGAGKTAFTRGLAAGLGVTECVTSPTYTIVNEYLSGRMPLFHFDMYRLSSSEELFDIGWRTIWRAAVCARWSGAKMWKMRSKAQLPSRSKKTPCSRTGAALR